MCGQVTSVVVFFMGLYLVQANTTKYLLPRDGQVEAIKHATRWYVEHGKMSVYSRPVSPVNGKTIVHYTVKLVQLVELDVKSQLLIGKFWQHYKWMDTRVAWDMEDFDNISVVQIPHAQSIWAPDVMLYNEYDMRQSENYYDNIHHTGQVTWIPSTIYTVPCTMDITYFPFDTHTCDLTFGSWKLNNNQLDLIYGEFVDFGTAHNWENAEWELFQENVTIIEKDYPIGNWSLVHYKLTFKRRVAFFTYVLVLPSILMSLLTLLVFWLPPESEEKISIGLSLFLTYFVLLMIVVDATPKSGFSIPLLGEYLFVCIALIALSIFACALVYNIAMRDEFSGCLLGTNKRILILLAKIMLISTKKFTTEPHKDDIRRRRPIISGQKNVSSSSRKPYDFHDNSYVEPPGECFEKLTKDSSYVEPPGECVEKLTKDSSDQSSMIREEWRLLAKVIQRAIFAAFFTVNLVVLLVIFFKFWLHN